MIINFMIFGYKVNNNKYINLLSLLFFLYIYSYYSIFRNAKQSLSAFFYVNSHLNSAKTKKRYYHIWN